MGWKDWSYWLKGGIIGFIIWIIYILFNVIDLTIISCSFDLRTFFDRYSFPIGNDKMYTPPCSGYFNTYGFDWVIYLEWFFVLVIIGLLIGFVYGKIKNRGKENE